MPPKKRRSQVDDLAGEVKPTVEVPSQRRVTRSLTRADAVPPPPPSQVASKRKGKKAKTTAEAPKTTAEEEKKDETEDTEEEEPVVDDGDAGASGSGSAATTIVIEHCKQCGSFKTRAKEAQTGLNEGLPGTRIVVNPKKPRKGCFEIRAEGEKEQTFVSLLDMKRPFQPMKDLDMQEVIADIIEKIQG
ncbi:uncharacterized protein LOC110696308 [Chenopodium quinoa]|uniref:uncharacterized protein LOC110696308 n=1 Tax=Chenopodium quinoa TaxID=63459 RepID=UPI000B79ABCC|nr:uncharacterized protein LOC110696308 [Chenopodium quinoa]